MYFRSLIESPMKITSNTENFAISSEKIFDTLVNFTKRVQMPDIPQISNWTVTDDSCSFSINGLVTCQVRLTEQVPFSKVGYHVDTDKRISADAVVHIVPDGSNSNVQVEADADVPLFLQVMLKGTLEQALNQALSRIKEMAERSENGI